jgi:hypothetical protein
MRFNKSRSSFFPVLIKTVQNTSGPILELGSGYFGTPLLHWLSEESDRRLVTYEDKQEYYAFARRFRTDTHEVHFVTDWDKANFDKEAWDVVFVDHRAERRVKDILRLKNRAKYIVIHDTEEKIYGFDKIWPRFKHVYHWNFDTLHTSVVSNLVDLKIFNPTKGLVYYTNNKLDKNIFLTCQKQLKKCMKQWEFPVYSISQKPIDFGINTVMHLESSILSMYKQIYEGLQKCQTDVIFLIEHDVLYHPSHFDFTPEDPNCFYYNQNEWHVSSDTGKTVFYLQHDTSQLCAFRKLLMVHFKRAIEVNTERFRSSYGVSPPRGIPPEDRKGRRAGHYMSKVPNVNIRHSDALSRPRMTKAEFRSERSRRGWTESDGIPGWGKTLGRFDKFLKKIAS